MLEVKIAKRPITALPIEISHLVPHVLMFGHLPLAPVLPKLVGVH